MNRGWTILLVAAAAACFFAAGQLNAPIRRMRAERGLNPTESLRNVPPIVTFTTVALGGFRGIIADALWVRATELQDEGKYLEIVQLADWITKLEPRFAPVWIFHAWNMAYNISAVFPHPEDRWRWVNQGIRLLRDEGIRCNPTDANLCTELSWIYKHKVGGPWDEAAGFYRREFARETSELLGGGRPDYTAGAGARREQWESRGLAAERMQEVERAYGVLDWRAPEAHALYWGWRGLQIEPGSIPASRAVFQSAAAVFHQGRIVYEPRLGMLLTLPYPEALDGALRAYEDAIARIPGAGFETPYMNFLSEAVFGLVKRGDAAGAARAYARLTQRFPDVAGGSLDAFVEHELAHQVAEQTPDAAAAAVRENVRQSITWLVVGGRSEAAALLAFSRRLWETADAQLRAAHASPGLPPYDQLCATARTEALSELPESLAASVRAAQDAIDARAATSGRTP